MTTVLAVSPHLDDAAFSCGGTLGLLAAAGAEVTVATVFTASVPAPTGFALACQTDKGLAADVDYMQLRRAEDEAAMRAVGARPVHLGLAEAPHRGYDDASALFGAVVPDDVRILERIEALLSEWTWVGAVLAPLALGDHVDHRVVHDAVESWAQSRGIAAYWWHDMPYALRVNAADAAIAVPLPPPALDTKIAACRAYVTQLDFQFGGVDAMEVVLRSADREPFSSTERGTPLLAALLT